MTFIVGVENLALNVGGRVEGILRVELKFAFSSFSLTSMFVGSARKGEFLTI